MIEGFHCCLCSENPKYTAIIPFRVLVYFVEHNIQLEGYVSAFFFTYMAIQYTI